MKKLLSIAAMTVLASTIAAAQEEPSDLSEIMSLDFVREVHDLSSFTFESQATLKEGLSIWEVVNQVNEKLASDGKGHILITSYTYGNPCRLTFSVEQVPKGEMYRIAEIMTGDGEMHSIIQATNNLSPIPSSTSAIFPNPAFGKTFTVSGCAPQLEWYMARNKAVIEDSMQEGTGGSLVFGPYWEHGSYSVYNEYLGFSTYEPYLSWYDIFTEGALEMIDYMPEQINIPYGGGMFEYDIRIYFEQNPAEYSYIAEQMNTLGIPGYWKAGSGMTVEMTVTPGESNWSVLHLTFLCEPNFTSTVRRQNTMFCLASSDGKTVKLVQPGNPSGQLESFVLTGEWDSPHDFSLELSGSQPGVTYTLMRNGTAVKSAVGTGKPINWGNTSVQGSYMVRASFGTRSKDMDGVLEMKLGDYVFGNNYVLTKTMLSEDADSTVTDVTYYDGLGYPVQIQRQKASGNGHALVTPIVYDDLRRPDAESYLSYPSLRNTLEYVPEALGEDFEYHSEVFGEEGDIPFTERTFETYLNGRVLSVRRPGFSYWDMDKKVEFAYRLNSASDSVRQLHYIYASEEHPDSVKCRDYYPAGVLECTMTVNEDADTSYVFVNPFGRQVLSRRLNGGERYDSYFVYDLKDSLVCVVQPGGSISMPDEFSLRDEFSDRYCFTYRYDAFGNVIERHIPGAGHEEIFYDLRNRPVLWRDSILAQWGKYRYVLYDEMDRVTSEGYCSLSMSDTSLREYLEQGGNVGSLITSARPVRAVVYYDAGTTGVNSGFVPDAATGNSETLDLQHCMTLPMNETLYPEPDITDGDFTEKPFELRKEWFYDSFGRPVQIAVTGNDGTKSYLSYKYDFVGNVLVSSEKHCLADGHTDDQVLQYTYDSRGRVLTCSRSLNGNAFPQIRYGYDDLGQIGTISVPGRIATDYTYNLQGAPDKLSAAAYGSDAFMQELRYNDPVLDVSVPSYSGRISEIGYSDAMQDYQFMSYYYDHAGRLSDSRRTGNDKEPYGEYEERDMKYDANGNLLSMKRIMSLSDSTRLAFGYSGNRMETVSVGDSLWSYSYDSDGNMVSDGHRGLELSYNFLNLPARVRVKGSSTLVYSYLSDGTMVSVSDSISGKGLRFRGSFIYRVASDGAESLESVSGPEGRVYALSDGGYSDTWFVRDYLGSVRAVVDITDPDVSNLPDVILHRSDYLPSGVAFSPAAYSSASASSGIPQSSLDRWRFNGKPEQVSGLCDTGLLDYGARFYDPYIVRWTTADPMAANYPGTSPYSFCGGDPVNYIDPEGMAVWAVDPDGRLYLVEDTDDIEKVYFINSQGNLSTDYITVNSRDMIEAFVGNDSEFSMFTTENGINDIFKLFKFFSDNTDVEWVVHRNGDSYTLGTKHNPDNSGGWVDYGLDKPDASVHSHPGIPATKNDEEVSMGLYREGPNKARAIIGNDWYNVRQDIDKNGKAARKSYVYFPISKNYYIITYNGPQLIKR